MLSQVAKTLNAMALPMVSAQESEPGVNSKEAIEQPTVATTPAAEQDSSLPPATSTTVAKKTTSSRFVKACEVHCIHCNVRSMYR